MRFVRVHCRSVSWPRLGALAFLTAASLTACGQPEKPAVSLEEAKKITAQFQPQGFTPPPRTIADITAILDQERPDPAKIAALHSAADASPPAGVSGAELARFYLRRGDAASELGRNDQRLADYTKAYDLIRAQPADPMELMRFREYLANATLSSGSPRKAIELREQNIGPSSSDWGMSVSQPAILAVWYARYGDLARASLWLERASNRAEALRNESRNWRVAPVGAFWFFDQARGEVLDYTGRYEDAESYLRRVVAGADDLIRASKTWPTPPSTAAVETHRTIALRDLAVNLMHQGRLVEAEVYARQSLLNALKYNGRYSEAGAWNGHNLASVLKEEGRSAEAERLERVALDTYVGLGHEPQSAALNTVRAEIMSVLVYQRRWKDALDQLDQIRTGVAQDPALLSAMIERHLEIVIAAIHEGRAQDALEISRSALDRRQKTFGEKHYVTAEARGFYATTLAATGDRAGALQHYREAIPILLAASRQSEDESNGAAGREARRAFILEGYLSALAEEQRAGRPDAAADAFRIADAARGGMVQRALAASAARAAVKDPVLADLVRREQDAQKQVSALNGLITNALSLPSGQQNDKVIDALRVQIDQLRGARATIREEIERRFPDYVNLIDPKSATVEQTQAALQPGEALIATYVAEDRTYVWAVPKQGPVSFAAVPLKRGELEAIVATLRKALEPNASTLGEIPPFDVATANRLYALLLKPVEPGWKGAKSLLVVPHGALGQLPLGLLVTSATSLEPEQEGQALFSNYKRVPWLVREVAVTQLPSVASLTTLRALAAAPAGRRPFAGFGDPWFSPTQAAEAKAQLGGTQIAQLAASAAQGEVATRGVRLVRRAAPATETLNSADLAKLPPLPETAAEVREVAKALNADPATDIFLGAQANERVVETMKLDDRRVVMFATHGLVPGDLNGLAEPALALSAPQVAGVGGDGLLTTSKILGLKLDADWVVLSACNTAAGNGAGAEAVSGLGLAFFYAGTRAVLVTNWPVETSSARALTTGLFRAEAEKPGLSRAEALRQAELALIDGEGYADAKSNRTLFSYAHPIFWAPFSLVGDGGRH